MKLFNFFFLGGEGGAVSAFLDSDSGLGSASKDHESNPNSTKKYFPEEYLFLYLPSLSPDQIL
jgi:hypothetical protein